MRLLTLYKSTKLDEKVRATRVYSAIAENIFAYSFDIGGIILQAITITSKDLILRLTGSQGKFLRVISEETGVDVGLRGHTLRFKSDPVANDRVGNVIAYLERSLRRGHDFSSEDIRRVCRSLSGQGKKLGQNMARLDDLETSNMEAAGKKGAIHSSSDVNVLSDRSAMMISTPQKGIRLKSASQSAYIDMIRSKSLTFGLGPAGTGKTYLAMACAVDALVSKKVKRIVLSRPAVEAGENLGFLPGDLAEKVDPYLRPLQDALFEFLGADRTAQYYEKGVIEIAPLAFMRGRTLSQSFVVLDEAQNTTKEQMLMFLTRIGDGSSVVITGDLSQTDLKSRTDSGLGEAIDILGDIEEIGIHAFKARDVLRHPLVQKIVASYERSRHQPDQGID